MIIIIAACLLALAPSDVQINPYKIYTLYLDSDFTKTEKEAITNAANLWTETTHGLIKFKFIEKQVEFNPSIFLNENVIWRADENDINLLIFELMVVGGQIIGFAPPSMYVVLVPDRTYSKEHLEVVVAHELGHHIGMKHTPSIMDSQPTIPCITATDISQFCKIHGCENIEALTPKCFGSALVDDYND